ncbi:MAG: 1-deoxy-D-xylulose-5-phosphate reductoisomerase [Ruminococcaceae bacterium]|nr:1-deoxy-D-xylulose-5-phosphate reductoisomerase [Oscillospiraceae bacterium]
MKKIAILGSTGSIGKQSLDVVRMRGFSVTALTANSNVDVIEEQAREFKPRFVALHDENAAKDLKIKLADTDIRVLSGLDGICECASLEETDTVLNSVVGMVGLKPTVTAIEAKKEIALANKETLVAAGKLVTDKARENNVRILPVDSEHSAIFQSLGGCVSHSMIKRLILTASGGPFFGKKREDLENVTVKDALNHPNWSMGAKITIDSATMMNKGLELIEAAWLFDMPADKIDIVVHRQSIIHSLVEYVDNSVIAQLGLPDMRIPIQYALTYPVRYESPVKQLNLTDFGTLTFENADEDTFSCIKYCKDALTRGGTATAIANSANEEANKLFREGKIKFLQIADLVGQALENIPVKNEYTLEDIFETDIQARNFVTERSGRN